MNHQVVGIGEILWDHLPGGSTMGGAPANFACHARALGAESAVVSRVGDDGEGHGLLAHLSDLGVGVGGVSTDDRFPTGSVSVELLDGGLPRYVIAENVAWDHLVPTARAMELLKRADAVCFGTLAQRSPVSAAAIHDLVGSVGPDTLRVLDVNLRQDVLSAETIESSFAMADVLKLNDEELPRIAKLLGIAGSLRETFGTLVDRFGFRMIAYTRGANGSVLFDGAEWCEGAGREVKLRDTIGAGDSFVAALTLGVLKGWPIDRISLTANEVAAYVCSMPGAIPALPAHLVARFADGD